MNLAAALSYWTIFVHFCLYLLFNQVLPIFVSLTLLYQVPEMNSLSAFADMWIHLHPGTKVVVIIRSSMRTLMGGCHSSDLIKGQHVHG